MNWQSILFFTAMNALLFQTFSTERDIINPVLERLSWIYVQDTPYLYLFNSNAAKCGKNADTFYVVIFLQVLEI